MNSTETKKIAKLFAASLLHHHTPHSPFNKEVDAAVKEELNVIAAKLLKETKLKEYKTSLKECIVEIIGEP